MHVSADRCARGHDRRVDVDGEQAAVCTGRRVASSFPRPARAVARAARIAVSARGASPTKRATSRETTGSEATGPNSSGWGRSIATSGRQYPPSVSVTARSVTIFRGLCTARGCPPSFQRCVQAVVRLRGQVGRLQMKTPGRQKYAKLSSASAVWCDVAEMLDSTLCYRYARPARVAGKHKP